MTMKMILASTALVACLATSSFAGTTGSAGADGLLGGSSNSWGYTALNAVTFGLYGNFKAAGAFKHGEWKTGTYLYSRPLARPKSMVKTTTSLGKTIHQYQMTPGAKLRNSKSYFMHGNPYGPSNQDVLDAGNR